MRAVEPHLAAEMLAKIDQHREAAGASRAQRVSTETMLPIQVEQERAQTKQYEAQTKSTLELLDYQKRNINANISQSMEAAGASRANADEARLLAPKRAALLDKQNAEYVDLELKGQKFSAKGMDLLRERDANAARIAAQAAEHQKRIREAKLDDQKALKESSDAETDLKTLKIDHYSRNPDEMIPKADLFHALSKKPYVYIFEPGEEGRFWNGSDTLKPLTLPKVGEHQYVAQEVYDAAVSRSMSVQDYLEQVFYPSIRQPVPWRQTTKPK